MSLLAWQGALVELIGGGESALSGRGLSPTEAAWFRTVADAPGTRMTRAVAASWRVERVSRSTPLTLLALAALGLRSSMLSAYCRQTRPRSSYLVTEGLAFLDFVNDRQTEDPHLRAMTALDRAILRARITNWRGPDRTGHVDAPVMANDWIQSTAGGAVVEVHADPRALLLALVSQSPLPEPGDVTGAFVVGPGIEGRFREASAAEARVYAAAAVGASVADVVQATEDGPVLDCLVQAGVLSRCARAPVDPKPHHHLVAPTGRRWFDEEAQ